MDEMLNQIRKAVIEAEDENIGTLTEAALAKGLSPQDILNKGLMPAMEHVGVEFAAGNLFVPQVLFCAKTMQVSMEVIRPLLSQEGIQMAGKAVIGTVKGDLHDIGKNLVRMMLEGAGFEVVDLGRDVPPNAFVEAVQKEKPDIVGMSALLTTTMRAMGTTIKALEDSGTRGSVKVMVGGAPVTSDFAEHIGADGYASNAMTAVEMAKKFLGK